MFIEKWILMGWRPQDPERVKQSSVQFKAKPVQVVGPSTFVLYINLSLKLATSDALTTLKHRLDVILGI